MNTQIKQQNIRNVAIIAHVDHGKTTLIDAFLKQTNTFRDNQSEMDEEMIMDSSDLEREKGITITAKNTAIFYKDYKINIIDTPGHADFGGEVERTINMADGCILLVDAQEGPMPQTKFVLEKAFKRNLPLMVIINKIDKKFANTKKVIDKITDLFLSLASDESQLDFPVFYAIGREGKVFRTLPDGDLTVPNSIKGDILPLIEDIITTIPAPGGDDSEPFQMQVASLGYNEHYGRYLIGKILRGTVSIGDRVTLVTEEDGELQKGNVKRIMVHEGLSLVDVTKASCGEIVAIAGINATDIGATLCDAKKPDPLPTIVITPPSIKIKFEANTSPMVGKEGKFVTIKQLQQRLEKEKETNVGLKIEKLDDGNYFVSGRGEMQLSILIETLRREGYEFQVRKPQVILQEKDGKIMEPVEEVTITAAEEYIGSITSVMSERKANLVTMDTDNGEVTFVYTMLTRHFLGLRSQLLPLTKGSVVIHNVLSDYVRKVDETLQIRNGALIAMRTGISKGYALNTAQERGMLFIDAGVEVYEGMIIGLNKYNPDLEIDVTKERHKSAHRIKHDEITQTKLKQLLEIDLHYALSFLNDDEILEITPKNLRLRKAYLKKTERVWSKRSSLNDLAKERLGIK